MTPKEEMIFLILTILIFGPSYINSKGLYSGVPCHLPYNCIFEENDDGFPNSLLVGEEKGVTNEKICQEFCMETQNCVSYTWWNENTTINQGGIPLLCQMFSVCHRSYQNPNLTPVYSGKDNHFEILLLYLRYF